ncbi:MAG: hypothetical protein WBV82_20200 [Myxococcaceae bacterium]
MDVAVVTCSEYPQLNHPYEQPLLGALRALGLDAQPVVWNGPDVDWSAPRAAIIRAAWDSHLHREAFLAWADHVSRICPLHNPVEVLSWNLHKSYLRTLQDRGVAVTPTVWLDRGQPVDVARRVREQGWDAWVVKPCVSAGAAETHVFRAGELHRAQAEVTRLAATHELMLQPYLRAFESEGERSYIFIDGDLSHAVRRPPTLKTAPRGFADPVPFAPSKGDELRQVEAVMDAVGRQLLYARVDMATDNEGKPRLQEVELVEPSLFLSLVDEAPMRLANAIARRLR